MSKGNSNKKIFAATWLCHVLFTLSVPIVFLFTMEWIHRGTLAKDFWAERFLPNFPSYLLSFLLILFIYIIISHLLGRHWPAVLFVGLVTIISGIVTWFKLQMRGEPFLPWDFTQIGDLMGVAGKVEFDIQPPMIFAVIIFAALFTASFFVRMPYATTTQKLAWRISGSIVSILGSVLIVFGIFLKPDVAQKFGIYSDMWMQDRYYKNYGIVTGFITNLVVLDIAEPENYSPEAVDELRAQINRRKQYQKPLFETQANQNPVKSPNIIYVMNESFWDASRLEGIEYDRELTPNLQKLKQEGASGFLYTPSFGGGTCDVEFEALTGFSVEHLPAGAKPYQQYVTKSMFSLPQYLKSNGYQTMAIHGYYRKFWSRNVAYPNLGIDTFIAAEDFVDPDQKRGFISDEAMTQRIIEEYEKKKDGQPVFIHAVTMQNHTTYDKTRYDPDELVNIKENTAGLSQETLDQLQDFATGVHEADAALGNLVDYFRTVDEPTVIVFWGDHFNPIGKGNEIYEKTGFIEQGATNTAPALRSTDLLIWSNYDTTPVDIGTIAAYNLSPVVMDLYGLEKPMWFEFLSQQIPTLRSRTKGLTVNPDGSYSESLSKAQEASFSNHWLVQYDLMFGEEYFNQNIAKKS